MCSSSSLYPRRPRERVDHNHRRMWLRESRRTAPFNTNDPAYGCPCVRRDDGIVSGALARHQLPQIRISNSRHCEPTGRANARPMTGSAKQSTAPRERKSGLLRRSAPRNDVEPRRRAPRGANRVRAMPSSFSPLRKKGAGNAGRSHAPAASHAKTK